MRKLLGIILVIVTIILLYTAQKPTEQVSVVEQPLAPVVQEKPAEPTLDAQDILRLVNEERAKVGVKPLVMDERLNTSAKRKSNQIVSEKNYSHIDDYGVHGYKYIGETMPECVYVSENLSDAPDNPVGSDWPVKGWMLSKPHREAMLDSRYEYTGIAVTDGYIAQHFCDIDK